MRMSLDSQSFRYGVFRPKHLIQLVQLAKQRQQRWLRIKRWPKFYTQKIINFLRCVCFGAFGGLFFGLNFIDLNNNLYIHSNFVRNVENCVLSRVLSNDKFNKVFLNIMKCKHVKCTKKIHFSKIYFVIFFVIFHLGSLFSVFVLSVVLFAVEFATTILVYILF